MKDIGFVLNNILLWKELPIVQELFDSKVKKFKVSTKDILERIIKSSSLSDF